MKQKPPLPPREGLERIKVNDLKPHERNARTHSKKQIRQIADSIERFGFTNPVLADAKNRIIAGHGRIEAAKLLKMVDVPVIRTERFTEAERRAYIIADNRLADGRKADAARRTEDCRHSNRNRALEFPTRDCRTVSR